jgi:hypothetical protein
MKTLLCSLAMLFMLANLASAQYPVVTQAWVPMVVNSTQYVPYNYSVTNYYTTMVPVNVPTVQYYQAPLYAPVSVVTPYVQTYRPFCNWHKPAYYNYGYYPYRY